MDRIFDVVMTKDRKLGHRVAHPVVRFAKRFRADEIVRCGEELLVAQVGDRAHLSEADVGAVRDQTGDGSLPIHRRFHVSAENMAERIQALTVSVNELQKVSYVDLTQVIEERIIDAVLITRIRQTPGDDAALFRQLDGSVLADRVRWSTPPDLKGA